MPSLRSGSIAKKPTSACSVLIASTERARQVDRDAHRCAADRIAMREDGVAEIDRRAQHACRRERGDLGTRRREPGRAAGSLHKGRDGSETEQRSARRE